MSDQMSTLRVFATSAQPRFASCCSTPSCERFAGSLGTMSFARPAARRLLGALPEGQGRRVRRVLSAARRRLPGAAGPVTYVVSPHPDGETLRLPGFVTLQHGQRPAHRVVLLALRGVCSWARAR